MRRIVPYAFLSVHTGEALPDIFSYNGVTTTRYASGSRLRNSVNRRSIAKPNKKRWFQVHEVWKQGKHKGHNHNLIKEINCKITRCVSIVSE